MYLLERIKNTMTNYSKIKDIINNADAIIIGAGSGLSTSAGINYSKKGFKEKFPELTKKYGMTDMYTSSFYDFKTEEEKWSYWAKHIDYLYNIKATKTYKDLFSIVKNKNYFVITTNVDGQFLKAGFDKDKVFEVQGSLSKIQCAKACHNKLYDDLNLVNKMLKEDKNCKIPSNLVPTCPVCHGKMEVNLRKDEYFIEDDYWHAHSNNYATFVHENKDKNLVLLELGVGFNTPSIIRFPFEQMTQEFKQATLIRINDKHINTAFDLKDKAIFIKDDCNHFLNKITK